MFACNLFLYLRFHNAGVFFYATMDVNSDTWWLCESDVHQRLEMYTLKIWDSCAIAI